MMRAFSLSILGSEESRSYISPSRENIKLRSFKLVCVRERRRTLWLMISMLGS